MYIAICDDNFEYINTIENYFDIMKKQKPDYDVYNSGEELISAYRNSTTNYDAIFLDLEMDGMDGIETANLIRQFDKHVIIVFISVHTQYMKQCFECTPFRFLHKPVSYEEISATIKAIHKKLSQEKTTFLFSENREKVRLFCEDILYFESRSHLLIINTKEKQYKIHKTLSELCKITGDEIFCRVHNSFVVNLGWIKEVKDTEIILYDCDFPIPLGRKYKKVFVEKFINYNERKYILL